MTWAASAAAAVSAAAAAADAKSQKDAAKAQKDQAEGNAQFIKDQAEKARSEALPLFASGQESRDIGYQAALDAFSQSAPQQFSTFQQGNVGAQQALLAGLPQIQNAILGIPTDLSALQPQTIDYDTSFIPTEIPKFGSGAQNILAAEQAYAASADEGAKYSTDTIQAILGSGLFPKLTNKVTREFGDIYQIRPGEFQQFLSDRPRIGKFFEGEAMNIAKRKGILPSQGVQGTQAAQSASPLAGSAAYRRY